MADLTGQRVVLVVASNGYQPIEYGIPKKILEEHGIIVTTASNKSGGAVSSGESTTAVDVTLDDIDVTQYDGIFFIGGPGAMDYLDNDVSYRVLNQAKKAGLAYGAICIATRILAKANVLNGLKATGWDEDKALETILAGNGGTYENKDIVTDELVVTATGPKTADLFADGIMRVLTKRSFRQEE